MEAIKRYLVQDKILAPLGLCAIALKSFFRVLGTGAHIEAICNRATKPAAPPRRKTARDILKKRAWNRREAQPLLDR